MNKISAVFQLFLLAGAAFGILNLPTAKSSNSNDMGFYIRSAVTFVNEGSGIWNLTREDRSWSCFMNDSWQTVSTINYANPLETVENDIDGNKLAVFQFKSSLQPGENISDYIVFHVCSKPRSIPNLDYSKSETLAEIPMDLQEEYCGGEGFWMTNDSQIRTRAFSVAGSETRVLAIVAKLVSWIWNNINYQSHDPTFYPNETLSSGEGDCDEQAILLGTFCRVLGIPSYLQIGCVFVPEDSSSSDSGRVHYVEKQIGWHGWTVVYVPPWGWLPVDLTYIMGSRLDPLNSIRTAAVMSQYTIQGENVSRNDYLASDRVYEQVLEDNNFSLYAEDQMKEASPLLGDLNADSVVNIVDMMIAAQAFGSRPTDMKWNEVADVNVDGYVSIIDISIIAREFGNTA